MWPEFVIVSTPILHLNAGVVKTHEPMGVQALGSDRDNIRDTLLCSVLTSKEFRIPQVLNGEVTEYSPPVLLPTVNDYCNTIRSMADSKA